MSDGIKIHGQWYEDELVGDAVLYLADGVEVKGSFKDGEFVVKSESKKLN